MKNIQDIIDSIEIDDSVINRESWNQKLKDAAKGRISPLKGQPSPLQGRKGEQQHTEETKKRISEARKLRDSEFKHTEETKEYLREINLNKMVTEETRKRISKARLGKSNSEESNRKNSESNAVFVYSTPKGIFNTRKELREAYKGEFSNDQLYDYTRNNKHGFSRITKPD